MDERTERRQAWLQGGVVLAVVALVGAAAAVVSHQPDGADELKIPIAEARSQAAVLAWMASAPGRVLPPRFARAQREQVQKNVVRTRESLENLRPVAALQTAPQQAKPHVDALLRDSDAAALQAHERALETLEQGLKR
jgi:hypothetical protein